MSIADVASRVITKYIADTSEQKREIDSLIAKNKQLHDQERSAVKEREQHFDSIVLGISRESRAATDSAAAQVKAHGGLQASIKDSIGAYAAQALAIGAVVKAGEFAIDSLKSYAEHTRLESATAGINIDRLSDSFGGLVNQHDLLTLAAQTSKGVLALNQGQMETLGQAAVALKNRGFDLTESLEKLKDAAVKGKVGGLDDLGLSIKEGASKAETLRNMMTELNKVIAASGGEASGAASDIDRLSVSWDNFKSKAKNGIAESIMGGFLGGGSGAIGYLKGKQQEAYMAQHGGDWKGAFAGGFTRGRQGVLASEVPDKANDNTIDFETGYTYDDSNKKAAADAAKKLAEERKKLANSVAKSLTDSLLADLEAWDDESRLSRMDGGLGDLAAIQTPEFDLQKQFDAMQKQNAAAAEKGYADSATRRNESYLESTFGKLEDFDAYAMAFETLTGAVTTSMDAWITGSMSAGQALKKFFADALKGLASQMAVEALKHAAYGIGSLAFGDVRGAATHAAAAAAFGAGAVAAAVASRELGGGGSSAKGAGAGGGGSHAGGSGGGSGGSEGGGKGERIIVYTGGAFDDDTPRQRQIRGQRLVDASFGTAAR